MSYNPNDILGGGAWTFIEGVTISNQATVEFDLTGTYKAYAVHLTNIVPITDDIRLDMRYSVDGGSTFFSGSSDYSNLLLGTSATVNASSIDPVAGEITIGPAGVGQKMGTATAESLNGTVWINNPSQSTKPTFATFEIALVGASGNVTSFFGGGFNDENIDEVDAIQLYAFSGNLSTGRMELYGLSIP